MRHYNEVRLHGAIGHVTPAVRMAAQEHEIFAERDRRLKAARERRRVIHRKAQQILKALEASPA